MNKVYSKIESIVGSVITVKADNVAYGELAEIETRYGKSLAEVNKIDGDIEALAGTSGTSLGTGGKITKINAAKMCFEAGCDMVITNGDNPLSLYDIIDGKHVGTRFTEK